MTHFNAILPVLIYILIFFLIAVLTQKAFHQGSFFGKRSYDERQIAARGLAYKTGFYTLIIALCANSLLRLSFGSWGTDFTETFVIICIGLLTYIGICIFKDAYFDCFETPKRAIVIFLIVGGINLWSGIENFMDGNAFDAHHKFNNLNFVTGVLLLLVTMMLLIRWFMEKRYSEEDSQ